MLSFIAKVFLPTLIFIFINQIPISKQYGDADFAILESDDEDFNVTQYKKAVADCFGVGSPLIDLMRFGFQSLAPEINIHFYLQKDEGTDIEIRGDNPEWKQFFDITRRTTFIIHGYLATGQDFWVKNMARAFYKYREPMNIITVDWYDVKNILYYPTATMNTRVVGERLGLLISEIADIIRREQPTIPTSQWQPIHCVGHSLGAHICGFLAKSLKVNSEIPRNLKVDRITGLDPALPCFHDASKYARLDKSDAPFVDIIHTNIALSTRKGLGFPGPLGHMDFYPNGGHSQFGCDPTLTHNSSTISKVIDFFKLSYNSVQILICNHGRSYEFFTESIIYNHNRSFASVPWDRSLASAEKYLSTETLCNPEIDENCVQMGMNAIRYQKPGVFFTYTADKSPYCKPNNVDRSIIRSMLRALGLQFISKK